jgi:hypothetical protein
VHGWKLARETAHLDWSQYRPGVGLACLPAIVLALLAGVGWHQPAVGMIAAGAALNIGFGSYRKIQGSRLLTMFLGVAVTSVSAAAGTLAANSDAGNAAAAGAWGFVYGMLVVYGDEISWVGLQATIALLVSGAFPGSPLYALLRGGLVLAGGLLQVGLLTTFWRLQGWERLRAEWTSIDWRAAGRAIAGELNFRRPGSKLTPVAAQYALRVAFTLGIAVLTYRLLGLKNGYWLPLTTLLVLKPDFYRTYAGGLARVLGTLAGVTVATLLALLLRPQPLTLIALVAVFSWLSYAFQKVNYAIFTTWITSFIVFLIALAGLPEATVTVHRLLDTALGSGIAMISRAIGFTWKRAGEKHAAEKAARTVAAGAD